MARRGTVIVFSILGFAFLLSMGAFIALYVLFGRTPSVSANTMLTLELGGDITETSPTDVVSYLRGSRTPTVGVITSNLRKAKVDSHIKGVFLKMTGFNTPFWGKLQEIRDAIVDFKTSGKPVYAYLEYGGDRDYYVASVADKVFLLPSSPLDMSGVATYEVFLRGALDKFGVYPDLHHIGDYKTASNTFTETTFTPAHREMDEALNRDLFGQIVHGIADGRKQSDAAVRALIDEGPFLPARAREAGLIDEIGYEDEARAALREALGVTAPRELKGEDYAHVSPGSLGLNRGPRVGVIYAAGTITEGQSGFDPMNGATVGSSTLIDAIRAARKDSSLRAIVLRIDSPGGSAAASDAIWHELMLMHDERPNRPLIASMSDLAASGGYYIAAPADAIVAQPSTLTGSIGIFGGKFVMGGLYGKLGASIESTSIGKNAEMNSPARPFNRDETKKIDEQLNAFYQDFVRKVAASRKTTPERIDAIAQGRVWTGQQAKEVGLVDDLGGLETAVAVAKQRAGIPATQEVELVSYPAQKTFYQMLSEQMSGTTGARLASEWMSSNLSDEEREVLRAVRGPATMFHRGEALALMPMWYVR
ncbi:MAG: signal peptide peptidase SppA [Acidobacteriaceae bacterium]|jgi:protease-4|nr:signal peptide peptidase SppA [Acidobacteriaceae bacterium]